MLYNDCLESHTYVVLVYISPTGIKGKSAET